MSSMEKKIYILIVFILLPALTLTAQCPERYLLWKRIIFFRDSATFSPPPTRQLEELLKYEQSITNCPYRFDTTHSLLMQRIGALYLGLGEYTEALHYTLQSIAISSNNPSTKANSGSKAIIRSYFTLGRLYGILNRIPEKMAAMDSCVAISVRTGLVDVYSLYCLKDRVEYLFDIGDYRRGFVSANMGEAIIKKYVRGIDSIEYIIRFLTWKVNALLDFKDYDKAERLVIAKIADCRLIRANQFLGNLYEQLAIIQVQKSDFPNALIYFEQALRYHEQDKYDLGCEQTLTNLGYYLYFKKYKDYRKAISTYRRALRYLQRLDPADNDYSNDLLNIYSNIGNAFAEEGTYDSAFQYFRLAFDQVKPGFSEDDILQGTLNEIIQSKNARHIMSLLLNKGDAYFRQFKHESNLKSADKAIRIYKSADHFINIVNNGQSEVLSQLLWRGNTSLLYDHAIEVCQRSGNISDAFYFFEKGRAALLNNQLNEQKWMGAADILKQAQLKKKILQQERELEKADLSVSRSRELQEELFIRKRELDAVTSDLKVKNPFYYQNYLDSASITINDVKNKLLADHQALVEFFSGESSVYLFVVTPHQARLTRIDRPEFDSTVRLFNALIADRGLLNRSFELFKNTANHLYNLIFENNPVPDGRVIISPDGNYFPFEALITGGDKNVEYFLNHHAVSYTYSARFLMNEFDSFSDVSFKDFLGFAPVRYQNEMSLPSLPGSDVSLDKMKLYFSSARNFVGERASKANFLNQFYRYKIIQIFSHAADTSMFSEPVIYFSDSALYLSELIGEHKSITELVILSACETGTGKFYRGEGVFGFNRGFAALGIPSTIANLWSVDNKSSYLLTELFCNYVAQKLPLDVALQKAKLQLLSGENKLPYFWASSVLSGKTDVIELKEQSSIFKIFGFIALTVLVVLLIVKWGTVKKG